MSLKIFARRPIVSRSRQVSFFHHTTSSFLFFFYHLLPFRCDCPECRASTLDKWLMTSIGTGIVCLFLVVTTIVLCLSMADMLEGWHYALIAAESVLVGYQISVM
jgi:hypothetical protein